MRLVIVGAGENSTQAWHILKNQPDVEIVGFIDDDVRLHGTQHHGHEVLGGRDVLASVRATTSATHALIAIGSNRVRRSYAAVARAVGFELASAVHPAAIIDPSAHIGEGCIIEMGVCIHPEAHVGEGVFLGGSCVIAHHSTVGDYALIGGGVVFGGRVTIGAEALIGVGVALQPHVTVGARSVIGVGSAIVKDIPDDVVAVGVPAKVIRSLTAS